MSMLWLRKGSRFYLHARGRLSLDASPHASFPCCSLKPGPQSGGVGQGNTSLRLLCALVPPFFHLLSLSVAVQPGCELYESGFARV